MRIPPIPTEWPRTEAGWARLKEKPWMIDKRTCLHCAHCSREKGFLGSIVTCDALLDGDPRPTHVAPNGAIIPDPVWVCPSRVPALSNMKERKQKTAEWIECVDAHYAIWQDWLARREAQKRQAISENYGIRTPPSPKGFMQGKELRLYDTREYPGIDSAVRTPYPEELISDNERTIIRLLKEGVTKTRIAESLRYNNGMHIGKRDYIDNVLLKLYGVNAYTYIMMHKTRQVLCDRHPMYIYLYEHEKALWEYINDKGCTPEQAVYKIAEAYALPDTTFDLRNEVENWMRRRANELSWYICYCLSNHIPIERKSLNDQDHN